MSVPARELPTGEVTFFFTDVQGSTQLWEHDPAAMEAALAEHDLRLREVIERNHGYVFTTAGDSFAVAFPTAPDALAAAVESQFALLEPCADIELKVRMGIHTGTASARDQDYFGPPVNRCARLMSAAHGGQILVSGVTCDLLAGAVPDGVEFVDHGQHRLKDLLRPVRVFQVRHPELGDHFPPLRTLEGPVVDIPVQLTTFVGREAELADVRALLTDGDHRLVTLTGAGGAGKTRLAYQVAAESLESFPDGIRAVELSVLNDPDLILDEIAASVGTQAVPHVPLLDTVAAKIDGQQMLLVLDNSEQLIDAVERIVEDLLTACEHLVILATSRERLGAPGEVAYRVPSLSMPAARRAPTADDRPRRRTREPSRRDTAYLESALACDSIRLFADRAALARPGFGVTHDNVDDVVAICRRLDGIPLALELAAARLSVLSPAKIATRLGERFRLLVGDSRGTLERHQTLEATIAWSYEHLSEPAQAVFRRASVFSGQFDAEAAEAICVGGGVEPWDVLDQVSELVDKSLLVPEEDDDGEVRYRLLESMREFGAARLAEHGENVAVDVAHADYFVELGVHLQQLQRSGDIGEALVGLDRDMGNIRAALRFLLAGHRLDAAARLVGAIGYLWYVTGMSREGISWCRELFSSEPDLDDESLAAALHAFSTLLASWDEPHEGVAMLRREVELRRRIGDDARLAAALNNLGNALTDLGQTEEGEVTLRAAADHFERAGEPATLPLASLGYSSSREGRYAEAADRFTAALEQATESDDLYGNALAHAGLGEVAVQQGRAADARRHLAEAREGYGTLGVTPGVAYVDLLLGRAALGDGSTAEAAGHLAAALDDPDIHWSSTTKYWVMQLAARVLPDRLLSARLVGLAERHYSQAERPQPVWVHDDLAELRADMAGEIGDDEFAAALAAGGRLDPDDAVAATLDGLATLLQTAADEDDRGVN